MKFMSLQYLVQGKRAMRHEKRLLLLSLALRTNGKYSKISC